jgi:hypothetical protein
VITVTSAFQGELVSTASFPRRLSVVLLPSFVWPLATVSDFLLACSEAPAAGLMLVVKVAHAKCCKPDSPGISLTTSG